MAEDVELDRPLAQACDEDLSTLCAGTGWGGGAAQRCLRINKSKLTQKCSKEFFRWALTPCTLRHPTTPYNLHPLP